MTRQVRAQSRHMLQIFRSRVANGFDRFAAPTPVTGPAYPGSGGTIPAPPSIAPTWERSALPERRCETQSQETGPDGALALPSQSMWPRC